jgi:DNA-binding MarR family transcriptional regulator
MRRRRAIYDDIAGFMAAAILGLVDALVQLSFAVQGVLTAIAARHDLSITQVRILGILRDREPGMLELARALDLEKSSVSGLVGRAQKRGLVQRTAGGHADGRAVHVRLTAAGRAIAATFAEEVATELATLARGCRQPIASSCRGWPAGSSRRHRTADCAGPGARHRRTSVRARTVPGQPAPRPGRTRRCSPGVSSCSGPARRPGSR